ncbi:ABC transporter permease [Pelagibius marinus]|uniref:ABC transporter permease n=1 Tax=Pelagibius marinus TaxID=2762760 RepID=UPI001D0395E5|nr:ABC transporter permease [Pelagibius marinus]
MAEATLDQGDLMRTADGTPLKISIARAMRRNKLKALALIAPLFVFILFSFLIPIIDMSLRSVDNSVIPDVLPNTVAALADWDGEGLPPEEAFAALAADMKAGRESRDIGKVATRLNYELSGMRGTVMGTARRIASVDEGPYQEALIKANKDWSDPATWKLLKRLSSPYTMGYYLNAVDMRFDVDGNIEAQPDFRQIYVDLFLRTFWMSILITGLTILLGYPIAHLMATLPLRYSNLLMILVLLPFWTSLLVRTTAWIVMLQSEGVLNDLLVWVGVFSDDARPQLVYNKIGTIVAMTHILLPFMVLPLYSVMKTIPPSYMRAARSLGANQFTAFVRIYMPQTLSGIGAGSILVFILAIGYYITPALVGGTSGTLISNQIAYHMQQSLNWGLAAALGVILLATVIALYFLYNRIVGVDKMKLG